MQMVAVETSDGQLIVEFVEDSTSWGQAVAWWGLSDGPEPGDFACV